MENEDLQKTIKALKRQLERSKDREAKLKKEHKGNEASFTYWAGYSLGYEAAKSTTIEDILDKLT